MTTLQTLRTLTFGLLMCAMSGCGTNETSGGPAAAVNATPSGPTRLAVFGGGCFWCVEAVFEQVDGVVSVTSGYAGGSVPNPSYELVCTGTTGHAEVTQIEFDPGRVSYEQLLDLFWVAHDPTTLNRQGNDVGTQYRSVIFTIDDTQKQAAEKSRAAAQAHYSEPIVTEITPLKQFYPAEGYHQDYYRGHTSQPYCSVVIAPKLAKLQKRIEQLNAENAKRQ